MYSTLLFFHSAFRWLVLTSLVYAIYRSYRGWLFNKAFTVPANRTRHITVTIVHIQLVLGIWLYIISPVTRYFFQNFGQAVHVRDIRFFGMEHSLLMVIAVILITIGSSSAKRKRIDKEKYKAMAIWFSIGLIVILISIPWPFSPLSANRPYFRSF